MNTNLNEDIGTQYKTVTFSIGSSALNEVVTNTLYSDKYTEYSQALDTIKDLLSNIDMSENEKEIWCQDLLMERAFFTGMSSDDSLILERYENEDYEKIVPTRLFEYLFTLKKEISELKASNNEEDDPYSLEQKNLHMKILDEYLQQQKLPDDVGQYGWLRGDGKFFPVEWAKDQEWAWEHVQENYEFDFTGWSLMHVGMSAGDFLVHKLKWCLLHSPSQGRAIVTFNELYGLTDKQRHFIYDYYLKFNDENLLRKMITKYHL